MPTEHQPWERLGLARDALAGQVAVVSGGGQGIGLSVAQALAWLGARVAIAEISEPAGTAAAAAVRASGGEALFVPTDVSRAEDVVRLALEVRTAFGPVGILINNAIVCPVAPIAELDVAVWDRVMAVNLRGAFLMCKAFLPDMLARRQGTIINMVSTDAMPGLAAYIASKRGLTGLSQSLAAEVGEQGVNVVAFAPGFVDTPGLRNAGRDLAPRLGMSPEQFYGLSLHPAYSGMMPAEDAGAAAAYLVAAAAREYHGETVTGYDVLERAGYLAPPAGGMSAPAGDDGPAPAADLARRLQATLADTEAELARLPVFVRPLARAGFKSKSGQSLPDWLRTADRLAGHAEAMASGVASVAAWAESYPRLRALLGQLSHYYEGVPGETARFTRDAAVLQEVKELTGQRVGLIRDLTAALDQLADKSAQ